MLKLVRIRPSQWSLKSVVNAEEMITELNEKVATLDSPLEGLFQLDCDLD